MGERLNMRNLFLASIAAATVAMAVPPAEALPIDRSAGVVESAVTQAQWRGHRWPMHHQRFGRGYGHHRHHGGGLGAGIAGFAAGAIIGGALGAAQSPAYAVPAGPPPGHEYCASRFRSYDPASGTYLGYDGLRHPCP
jgi:hypothetical protein